MLSDPDSTLMLWQSPRAVSEVRHEARVKYCSNMHTMARVDGVQDAHMTVYALHAQCSPGGFRNILAHLRQMRQRSDDGLQPPASAPVGSQKRQSDTGVGVSCTGGQYPSCHESSDPSSIGMHADVRQKEGIDDSSGPHPGRRRETPSSSCRQDTVPKQRMSQSKGVQESSPGESRTDREDEGNNQCRSKGGSGSTDESDDEEDSCSDSADSEEGVSGNVLPGGKQGTAGQAQQAAY